MQMALRLLTTLAILGECLTMPLLSSTAGHIVLSNQYISITVSTWIGGPMEISSLKGDSTGMESFEASPEILDQPIRTYVQLYAMNAWPLTLTNYAVISRTGDIVAVQLAGSHKDGHIQETLLVEVHKDSPEAILKWNGALFRTDCPTCLGSVQGVYHSVTWKPLSVTALYMTGVQQMMNKPTYSNWFPSNSTLPKIYGLGPAGKGAVEVKRETVQANPGVGFDQTAVFSSATTSGFTEVVAGAFSSFGSWGGLGWNTSIATSSWSAGWSVSANQYEFPPGEMPIGMSLLDNDARVLLTGVWGSAVPTLATAPGEVDEHEHVYQSATSLAAPDRGYSGGYNFFDPDNYLTMNSMFALGDEYINENAKKVLERSGGSICTHDTFDKGKLVCQKGQIPHHFLGLNATYAAISGETQTGPNIFWTLTCLDYARYSGDLKWLAEYMPVLRQSMEFVQSLLDPVYGVLLAPGSLLIDVFVRKGFTSDTNSIFPYFLDQFAEAEAILGNSETADNLRQQANHVREMVRDHLWNHTADDHFITSVNITTGETKDMVDYDSNFIAVALGIADRNQSLRVLDRIDSNPYAVNVPTWPSEIIYVGSDTTGGLGTGDAVCGYGRIAWFNALARKRIRTSDSLAFFNKNLYSLISADLLSTVWMYERYSPDGTQESDRTPYYFEYPSVAALMVQRVRYGIDMGFDWVSVDPWGVPVGHTWRYALGNVDVSFAQDNVSIRAPTLSADVPKTDEVRVTVTGLTADQVFTVTCCQQVLAMQSDSRGVVTIAVQRGCPAGVQVVAARSEVDNLII